MMVLMTDASALLQIVREHPWAAQSIQLQQLIHEAITAQKQSQTLSPRSQVMLPLLAMLLQHLSSLINAAQAVCFGIS